MTVKIIVGDCREELRKLDANSVHCCGTSPPYWGLRDYGIEPSVWGGLDDCAHAFADEEVEREFRKGMGLEELGKRYRGGGKKHGVVGSFTIRRGFCVHCGAWRGVLGLEPTPELFVEHMVMVFEEIRRVLRPDGTCWMNLGDSYFSGSGAGHQGEEGDRAGRRHTQKRLVKNKGGRSNPEHDGKNRRRVGSNRGQRGDSNDGVAFAPMEQPNRSPQTNDLKPKDMVGVPWMTAFALRKAGWWLRQDVIWHKPNPMPESTTDRCTKAHEYVFLLTKSEHYYFDADAIAEDAVYGGEQRPTFRGGAYVHDAAFDNNGNGGRSTDVGNVPRGRKNAEKGSFGGQRAEADNVQVQQAFRAIRETRNKRSVWTIATTPFAEAHFATFPQALVEPWVLAGTSSRGCCATCGAGWERIARPSDRYAEILGNSFHDHGADMAAGMMQMRGTVGANATNQAGIFGKETVTLGWYPPCKCDGLPKLPKYPLPPKKRETGGEAGHKTALAAWRESCKPVDEKRRKLCVAAECVRTSAAIVLDPFGGAGTTGIVADRLHRDAVLIERNPQYAEMALRRVMDAQSPLFSRSEIIRNGAEEVADGVIQTFVDSFKETVAK